MQLGVTSQQYCNRNIHFSYCTQGFFLFPCGFAVVWCIHLRKRVYSVLHKDFFRRTPKEPASWFFMDGGFSGTQ